MKSCIRVPRVFLPRENYESWAVPACDRFACDRAYWQRVSEEIGNAPSILPCILLDVYAGEEEETRIKEIAETIYEHLESGALERLNRGMILVERETTHGLRRGILAALDLEEFSPACEKGAMIRAVSETISSLVAERLRVRRQTVLEFPHAIILYRDKRDKILRSLDDDLEELYDFSLAGGGGKIRGYFLPEVDAQEIARDLVARADPCFIVADGVHSLAAAKAHWEEVGKTLSPAERNNHPARFMLAEFVNSAEESVVFEPMHRLLREIEPEAFCDYFSRNVKCKREGRILYPILAGTEGYCKTEQTIKEFIRQNYGRVEYRTGSPKSLLSGDDCAVVALPAVEKEELYAAVKSGKRFPAKTFCLGAEQDARYSLEGREISYD